jgi:hypothetical protein
LTPNVAQQLRAPLRFDLAAFVPQAISSLLYTRVISGVRSMRQTPYNPASSELMSRTVIVVGNSRRRRQSKKM